MTHGTTLIWGIPHAIRTYSDAVDPFFCHLRTCYVWNMLPAVRFLMSRIHPDIREEVSFHGFTCPLKLHHYLWHLLEAKTMVYTRSLLSLAHQQSWWCPLFLLRSYLPQETMAMTLMFECSPSVDHAMYKILTATRIAIDINDPTLQIPASCNYFDVEDSSCN